ncbi:MAG: hypothetical protein K6L76_09945 [Agarilytica sp.]
MKMRNIKFMNGIHDRLESIDKGLLVVAMTGVLLTACGGSATDDDAGGNDLASVELDLELPSSVTGGLATDSNEKTSLNVLASKTSNQFASQKAGDEPCSYIGNDDDDPFVNGYETTKFMVSAVAAWSCVAELLMEVSEFAPGDGTIIETDNDLNAENYEDDEPTHYSVVDDSEVQTSVRLYYGFDRETPPTIEDEAGFYLSWTQDEGGTERGRVIIDTLALDEETDEDDPVAMRMDFVHDDENKTHDLFLRFGDENAWAQGFRIRVNKNLDANPLEEVFVAQGLMAMTAQFLPAESISEVPEISFYSVANRMGDGASISEVSDLAISLPFANTHFGSYLTTKEDIYFFDDDQEAAEPWDWIEKTFTTAEYRGDRTASASGGTWVPFDPSLDMIAEALELDSDYFDANCVEVGDDCLALINAIFDDGFAEQEPNQGEDPNDWRSLSLQSATYLDSVFPNGVDWTDAFVQDFQP